MNASCHHECHGTFVLAKVEFFSKLHGQKVATFSNLWLL
jgi:hypothetical protein